MYDEPAIRVDSADEKPAYCSLCGDPITGSDVFCAGCGGPTVEGHQHSSGE